MKLIGNCWSFRWRFEIEFLSVGLFCNLRNQSLCLLLMAEDGLRTGGLSSGLAVILNGGDKRESSSKSHLVSYCDEFGHQSVERTLEHIFDLP